MENTPVAADASAPVAPAQTEATPITNPEPAQAPVQTTAPAQAPAFNITPEQQRFIEANGGFDKVFDRMKSAISNPQPAPQPAQEPAPAQQPIQQQVREQYQEAPQVQQVPQGAITQQEFAIKQYFDSLAGQESYNNIAGEIRSGEIFKEMAKFNIQPMINGNFNDYQVRQFLDMYAKTKPAVQTQTPITNTPTAEYINVGETITNRADALAVLRQNFEMKRSGGTTQHPMTAQAEAFLRGEKPAAK